MSSNETIEDLEVFNRCLDELAIDLVKNDLGAEELEDADDKVDWGEWGGGDEEVLPGTLDHEEVEKSALAASLLASSADDTHKRKALAFGILAYLKYHREDEFKEMYERYLYVILSRVGNLPAFQNVKQIEGRIQFEYDLLESLDSVLSTELSVNLNRYSMEDGGVLSGFQRQIYDYLIEGNDVAISGPTSAGKSFILRRYIEHKAETESEFEAIYVVPTRALIAEVSQKLTELNEDLEEPEKKFEVLTGAHFPDQDEDVEDEGDITNNRFLVVTPERCLKLIDPEVSREIHPDLVFFDEFQNLEDDERGVLFESIIRTLQETYPDAQVVAAGPYLEEPKDTLEKLMDHKVEQVTTKFTPVLQLKSTLKFLSQRTVKDRKLKLTIHSPSGNKKTLDIREPPEITYSDVKGSFKQTLPVIIEEFGAESQNLIYSGRKDYAEDRAKALANSNEPQPQSERVENLISFLKETIHEKYSLIRCLKRGVAFHHGMVPKIAREEIENIYSESTDIGTIVTTPTLMQGVNLPAEKIFLVGANRGQDELSDFEFNNLIGRVGRIDEKLYGAIYCIETEGNEWADEKLENSGEKEIEPATNQAVSEADELVDALQKQDLEDIDDPSIKYTSVLLRGRYLKDKSVDDYLDKKGMDQEDIKRAKSALDNTVSNISIPDSLLKENPTVDPVKQDVLYKMVQDKPEAWILANSHHQYSYQSFLELTRKLNRVFKFARDKPTDETFDVEPAVEEVDYGALEPIVITANHWLRGESYNAMIESRQDHEAVDDNSIDQSIREVMNLVNNDIRFIFVKYYGILTSILEEIDYEVSDWMLKFDQMLEMGSMNFNRLQLMSRGVDRSIAVLVYLPEGVNDPIEYINNFKNRLPPFQRRHFENQGLI
jgi:hypothetical protein